MGIKRIRLLARESICWVNINAYSVNSIKNCTTCPEFQATQLKDKLILYGILGTSWETVNAYLFVLDNKASLCIGDFQLNFLGMKLTDALSADSLIQTHMIKFTYYQLPRKNNVYCWQIFCFRKVLVILQVSEYSSNWTLEKEACINLVQHIMRNYFDTKMAYI